MRALLSYEPGGPETLRLVDLPRPSPSAAQVLLEVKACGVNYPDLLTIQDLYQVKTPRPFAPGAEVAGIVSAVGSEVTRFRIGQKLAARIGTGGMAEFVAVDASRCSEVPDGMSFADAAVMQFTFETAYYALHTRARLNAGETVLVLGAAGGVGIAAVQIARNLGATVVAAASSQERVDFACRHGAERGAIYPASAPQDRREAAALIKSIVGGSGADIIIDPVGGWLSETAIRSLAEGGKYLVVGFTAGIPALPLNLPLLKNCDVLGINWRTFSIQQGDENETNRSQLHRWYRDGYLRSGITSEFPLQSGAEAIMALAERRAVGKIVVTI